MTRNRRRQIIVNKPLQSRIIFATAWAPALCLAGATVLLGILWSRLYNQAQEAEVSLPGLLPVFLLAVAFMLVAITYMLFSALRFSHRIAGPMKNIGNTLQRFRDGDVNARVVLREKEYLIEVQDEINAFLNWLQQHPPKGYPPSKTNDPTTNRAATAADAGDVDAQEGDSEDVEVAETTAGR